MLREQRLQLGELDLEPAEPIMVPRGVSAVESSLGAGKRQREAGIKPGDGSLREAELVRRRETRASLVLAAVGGARLDAAGTWKFAVT